MSYATIEAAAITLVKTVSPFTANPTWVTAGDDTILTAGVTAAAIFSPGNIGPEEDLQQYSYREYEMIVALLVRIGETEAATFASFVTLRDALILAIEKTPHLGLAGALESSLQSESEPVWVYERTPDSGPVFLMQTLRWSVSYLTALSGGEF